jgi:hypothetical protein
MASVLSAHQPIAAVSTISGNQEKIQNFPELAGQTFQPGTPVVLSTASGSPLTRYAQAAVVAGPFYGISYYRGKNLASNGQGASPVFGSIGFPGGQGAVNDVVNQPLAYSIYQGAPYIDGLTLTALANLDTIFEVQVDNSTGTGVLNASLGDVGATAALAIDSTGFWYLDLNTINAGSGTTVTIVSLNPLDLVPGSFSTQQNFGKVRFVFQTASIQALA